MRPGPLKSNMDKIYLPRGHDEKPITYLHPKLENALGETLGVILYQEQVLKVAHDLAGMSYAEADGFRRAMTHDRTEEEMEKMRGSFIYKAVRNGVSKKLAEKVLEQLSAFAAYGFCKAHAAAYAELAIFLGSHFVVSNHNSPLYSVEAIKQLLSCLTGPLNGPNGKIYVALDTNTKAYSLPSIIHLDTSSLYHTSSLHRHMTCF